MDPVKVNAVIPHKTREQLREMAIHYETTVQKIVAIMIHGGLKSVTAGEIRSELSRVAKKAKVKQYVRTKPF